MRRQWLMALALSALASAGLAQKTLVFGHEGEPVNLESGNITDGVSIYAQRQIYDTLVDFKPGSTDPVPALATSWFASPDGKSWTFRLRQGVKFHDGTDFDANAVLFNVNRWWDPKDPTRIQGGANYEIWGELFGGYKGTNESFLKNVRVVDKYTIRFDFGAPIPYFPVAIGSGYFGIASPTAIKAQGAKYGTPAGGAVGTGPFRFKEWRVGDRLILEKNPNFWRQGLPKADALVMRFIKDPAARLAELRAGSIDLTIQIPPANLGAIEADRNLDPVLRPSFNVGYLALNPAYKPLSDVRVRQAIAMAINKKAIVQAFWGKLGETNGHFTPSSFKTYWSSEVTDYEYNPTKAKQLLAQAGYPNGFDLEFWYMPVSRPYFPTPKEIAEAMGADLSAIGIRVKFQTKDWATYLNDRKVAPGFQAYMLGWTGDYGDPSNFFDPHFASPITDLFDSAGKPLDVKELNALLAKGSSSSNQAERIRIYQQADKMVFDLALRIPIVHSQPLNAKRKNISGWVLSPLGSESLENVDKSGL
ncbi:ABC transporter substrate-binding protein [Calidithermus timidus]|jgi:peptide/nickel transport system substrate-binding protein|uniref:ABC transporter substrate-binding protein n=1 Tax=Calidithermus timidus TaxID=307124 RepID=UPI0004779784|nr:ABC transporter substrate-binding protein [Calidithermus timidus]